MRPFKWTRAEPKLSFHVAEEEDDDFHVGEQDRTSPRGRARSDFTTWENKIGLPRRRTRAEQTPTWQRKTRLPVEENRAKQNGPATWQYLTDRHNFHVTCQSVRTKRLSIERNGGGELKRLWEMAGMAGKTEWEEWRERRSGRNGGKDGVGGKAGKTELDMEGDEDVMQF
ncbi:hypothetical protein CBR_g12085 [Chara braunii]|uniref:Uncharacterized protein n=1 Tax=Chara braunii TaxID=69332 RepID=A0A388KR28_CHABU|nr:hypothetical protein CBR_g12085 [Chara braunii]|eukprot:GBG72514.1 hypothetical protein CBR_g12085 [Chara braunii]